MSYSSHMSTESNATRTAKCIACGRTRHFRTAQAAAKAAPAGRICRMKARIAAMAQAVKGVAEAQVDKARQLIADGGIVAIRPGVFQAVSSKGDATYLTHPQTCNCPAGLRGRSLCYHSLAARIMVAASAS